MKFNRSNGIHPVHDRTSVYSLCSNFHSETWKQIGRLFLKQNTCRGGRQSCHFILHPYAKMKGKTAERLSKKLKGTGLH